MSKLRILAQQGLGRPGSDHCQHVASWVNIINKQCN